jgi:hypothetical protein
MGMASPSTHGLNFFPRSFAGRRIGFAAVLSPLIQQSSVVLHGMGAACAIGGADDDASGVDTATTAASAVLVA